ncbi:MAG: phage terminase large subunit, partial [Lachnospiraceae bacterium]|nr:phage terminase large subunit [Lachnospiraceae bacterium]
VPTRFVAETFGFNYVYDSKNSKVILTKTITIQINKKNVIYNDAFYSLYYGNDPILSDSLIINYKDTVYAPAKLLADALDCQYAEEEKIFLSKEKITLQLENGSYSVLANDIPLDLGAAPINISDQIYIPLEASLKLLGFNVEFSEKNYTYEITKTDYTGIPELHPDLKQYYNKITVELEQKPITTYFTWNSKTNTNINGFKNLTKVKAYSINNADVLEKHWSWFTDTMLSRLEEGGKIIIVMTRWHSEDLAGKALKYFAELGWKIQHISYRARSLDGKMLCDEILSEKSYYDKKKIMGDEIFSANYDQEPIDMKGRLYTSFKTYTELPKDSSGHILGTVKNYTDTADTGDDYLCSINYIEYAKEAYIINVLYTKDGMEKTEPATAKMLYEDKVNVADIESNNGGRGFARNVERELHTKYHSNHTIIRPFYQSKNKKSRILSNSTWVMNHIYFPVNWKDKWSEYYDSMIKYQKEGKNAHDDAQDATTGVAERINQGDIYSWE